MHGTCIPTLLLGTFISNTGAMGLQATDHEVVMELLCILHRHPHDACVHGDGGAEHYISAAAIQYCVKALIMPPANSRNSILSAACMAHDIGYFDP